MSILAIEELSFGVEDRKKSRQFLADFGLKAKESDREGSDLFTTLNQSKIYVYDHDDARLPTAIEKGSTLREVVWAVESDRDLEALAERLQDEPNFASGDNFVECDDPNGTRIRFRKSETVDVKLEVPGINQYGDVRRIDEASPVYQKAEPIRVGHVVFFTPDLEKTQKFYEEKLGFYLSDAYNNRGAFLRCQASGYHHDLFLLKLPNRETTGLNHVAFVVRDIHEVIGGGINMNRTEWSTFVGPGRHPVSSAYFWYVNSPLGGAFEYYTNDDFVTPNWQPRHLDYRLDLFTEWAVEGGIDEETRRQIKS